MGTVDSISTHREKPHLSIEDGRISNVSITQDQMKEKQPVPEYNIDDEYYNIVGQICNFDEKMAADIAVRT